MGIDEIRETMDSCKHCFMCRHACPTFLTTKLDSHTPRGYALMMAEVDAGKLRWAGSVADRFYQCSQCGLCRQDCAYHWAEDDLVRHGREEIVAAGAAPARIREIADRLMKTGTPVEGGSGIPAVMRDKIGAKGAEVLYVAGWAARREAPETIEAMAKIFDSLKVTWCCMEDEGCGIELLELGYAGEARRQAAAFVKRVAKIAPKRIVSSCPHLCRALREQHGLLGIDPPSMPVLHTAEFLAVELEAGRLSIGGGRREAVGYHDPCQLGRKLGIFDEPRRVIAAAIGAPPLELYHSREAAECCGAGSVMLTTEPDLAADVARRRLEGARNEGVRTLVTACGNCKTLMRRALEGDGSGMEVLDIAELAAASLRS
ncbi:MAG: (Fe-S)-binding protein [Spirochaetes bacterium]|nr:(Fe-S)-binding protein [Spirochaetota bacterium]